MLRDTCRLTDSLRKQKTYICTTSALSAGYCGQDQLGQFILDLPKGKNVSETTFWSARVELSPGAGIRDLAPPRRWPPTVVGPDHILKYTAPIHYPVHKTGFYCVGTCPSHFPATNLIFSSCDTCDSRESG